MKAAMKAKKAMKVSMIARGKMARAVVFRGSKEKTGGGMTKDKLVKNRNGRIVSKAASARAKKKPMQRAHSRSGWRHARQHVSSSTSRASSPAAARRHRGKRFTPRPKASSWASDVRGRCFQAAELCGHATRRERGIFPRLSDNLICTCHDAL